MQLGFIRRVASFDSESIRNTSPFIPLATQYLQLMEEQGQGIEGQKDSTS